MVGGGVGDGDGLEVSMSVRGFMDSPIPVLKGTEELICPSNGVMAEL